MKQLFFWTFIFIASLFLFAPRAYAAPYDPVITKPYDGMTFNTLPDGTKEIPIAAKVNDMTPGRNVQEVVEIRQGSITGPLYGSGHYYGNLITATTSSQSADWSESSVTIGGFNATTTYYFRVQALNDLGEISVNYTNWRQLSFAGTQLSIPDYTIPVFESIQATSTPNTVDAVTVYFRDSTANDWDNSTYRYSLQYKLTSAGIWSDALIGVDKFANGTTTYPGSGCGTNQCYAYSVAGLMPSLSYDFRVMKIAVIAGVDTIGASANVTFALPDYIIPTFDSVAVQKTSGYANRVSVYFRDSTPNNWDPFTSTYTIQYKTTASSTWINALINAPNTQNNIVSGYPGNPSCGTLQCYQYDVPNIAPGVSYDFRVAKSAFYAGAFTNGTSTGPATITLPALPVFENFQVQQGPAGSFNFWIRDTVVGDWTADTGNYMIQYKLSSSGSWTNGTIYSGTTNGYTGFSYPGGFNCNYTGSPQAYQCFNFAMSGFALGQSYDFQAVKVSSSGGSNVASNPSPIVTITWPLSTSYFEDLQVQPGASGGVASVYFRDSTANDWSGNTSYWKLQYKQSSSGSWSDFGGSWPYYFYSNNNINSGYPGNPSCGSYQCYQANVGSLTPGVSYDFRVVKAIAANGAYYDATQFSPTASITLVNNVTSYFEDIRAQASSNFGRASVYFRDTTANDWSGNTSYWKLQYKQSSSGSWSDFGGSSPYNIYSNYVIYAGYPGNPSCGSYQCYGIEVYDLPPGSYDFQVYKAANIGGAYYLGPVSSSTSVTLTNNITSYFEDLQVTPGGSTGVASVYFRDSTVNDWPTGVSYWKLQYKQSSSGSWSDFGSWPYNYYGNYVIYTGYPGNPSCSNNQCYKVNVSSLTPGISYDFRVVKAGVIGSTYYDSANYSPIGSITPTVNVNSQFEDLQIQPHPNNFYGQAIAFFRDSTANDWPSGVNYHALQYKLSSSGTWLDYDSNYYYYSNYAIGSGYPGGLSCGSYQCYQRNLSGLVPGLSYDFRVAKYTYINPSYYPGPYYTASFTMPAYQILKFSDIRAVNQAGLADKVNIYFRDNSFNWDNATYYYDLKYKPSTSSVWTTLLTRLNAGNYTPAGPYPDPGFRCYYPQPPWGTLVEYDRQCYKYPLSAVLTPGISYDFWANKESYDGTYHAGNEVTSTYAYAIPKFDYMQVQQAATLGAITVSFRDKVSDPLYGNLISGEDWDNVTNRYTLQYKLSSDTNWTDALVKVAKTVNATTSVMDGTCYANQCYKYDVTGLSLGQSYDFRVMKAGTILGVDQYGDSLTRTITTYVIPQFENISLSQVPNYAGRFAVYFRDSAAGDWPSGTGYYTVQYKVSTSSTWISALSKATMYSYTSNSYPGGLTCGAQQCYMVNLDLSPGNTYDIQVFKIANMAGSDVNGGAIATSGSLNAYTIPTFSSIQVQQSPGWGDRAMVYFRDAATNNWDNSTAYYSIQYKISSSTVWMDVAANVGRGANQVSSANYPGNPTCGLMQCYGYEVQNLQPGINYDFRVRKVASIAGSFVEGNITGPTSIALTYLPPVFEFIRFQQTPGYADRVSVYFRDSTANDWDLNTYLYTLQYKIETSTTWIDALTEVDKTQNNIISEFPNNPQCGTLQCYRYDIPNLAPGISYDFRVLKISYIAGAYVVGTPAIGSMGVSNIAFCSNITFNTGDLDMPIKASQVNEMRDAINSCLTAIGEQPYLFENTSATDLGKGSGAGDNPLLPGTPIRAVHLTQLREAVDKIYAILKVLSPEDAKWSTTTTWAIQDIFPNSTYIKKSYFQEVRDRLK